MRIDERNWMDKLGATAQELAVALAGGSGFGAKPQLSEEMQRELEAQQQEQANDLSAVHQFERAQIIDACKADLNFLSAVAMPEIFEEDFPSVHLLVWQLVTQELDKQERGFPKLALGIPRGHAKTTLVKLLILYAILFTKRKYILVISSIQDHAVNIIRDVIEMLEEPNVATVFGEWRMGLEINQADTKKFSFQGRSIILHAVGVLGKVRGTNLGNARPDFMIFEDVQTREAAMSSVQSRAIEGWMYATAMKAKSPHGCLFLFVANMYPTEFSILRKLKKNPKWIKFISGAILQDGTALWEAVHPLDTLIEEFEHDTAAGQPEVFLAEIQNETNLAAFNQQVDISKFVCRDVDDPAYVKMARFIVIDPATGKAGTGLDDVGIGYFETCSEAPIRPVSVEMILEPLSPYQAIISSLVLCAKYGCRVIGCEANAYQSTYLFWFNHVCQHLGISNLHFVELYTNTQSKNARVKDVIKAFIAHEIETTRATHSAIIKQAVEYDFTKTKNKDEALDLCAFAGAMVKNYQALCEALDPVGATFSAGGTDHVLALEDNCSF